jgi:hypothetical protein
MKSICVKHNREVCDECSSVGLWTFKNKKNVVEEMVHHSECPKNMNDCPPEEQIVPCKCQEGWPITMQKFLDGDF